MFDKASPFLASRPPQAQSRNAVAAHRLRQALISGEIRPGAAFGEAEISDRFRLGRAAVRVALTSLAAAGFVDRYPRQGWRATPVTGALIGDILGARRRLEPALAERRLDERGLTRLQPLAQIGATAIASGERKALSTARNADRQILDNLAQGAGLFVARWLTEAWDHVARIVHLMDGADIVLWPSDRLPLLAALASGDGAVALAEIERDIAHFQDACVRALLSSAIPDLGRPAKSARVRNAGKRTVIVAEKSHQGRVA